MIPQRFAQANCVMTAPPNMPDCYNLHTFTTGERVISAWRPSPEELVKINLGDPIWLIILGQRMPPVAVTANDPFQEPEINENKV